MAAAASNPQAVLKSFAKAARRAIAQLGAEIIVPAEAVLGLQVSRIGAYRSQQYTAIPFVGSAFDASPSHGLGYTSCSPPAA